MKKGLRVSVKIVSAVTGIAITCAATANAQVAAVVSQADVVREQGISLEWNGQENPQLPQNRDVIVLETKEGGIPISIPRTPSDPRFRTLNGSVVEIGPVDLETNGAGTAESIQHADHQEKIEEVFPVEIPRYPTNDPRFQAAKGGLEPGAVAYESPPYVPTTKIEWPDAPIDSQIEKVEWTEPPKDYPVSRVSYLGPPTSENGDEKVESVDPAFDPRSVQLPAPKRPVDANAETAMPRIERTEEPVRTMASVTSDVARNLDPLATGLSRNSEAFSQNSGSDKTTSRFRSAPKTPPSDVRSTEQTVKPSSSNNSTTNSSSRLARSRARLGTNRSEIAAGTTEDTSAQSSGVPSGRTARSRTASSGSTEGVSSRRVYESFEGRCERAEGMSRAN